MLSVPTTRESIRIGTPMNDTRISSVAPSAIASAAVNIGWAETLSATSGTAVATIWSIAFCGSRAR